MNAPLQTILNCLDYMIEYPSVSSQLGMYLTQCEAPRKYNSQIAINILSQTSGYRTLKNGYQDCRMVFNAIRDGAFSDVQHHFAFKQSVQTTVSSPCSHIAAFQITDEIMYETGVAPMSEGQNFNDYLQQCFDGFKSVSSSYRCTKCFPTLDSARSANALGSTTITSYHSGTPPFLAISIKLMIRTNVPPVKIEPTQQLTIR